MRKYFTIKPTEAGFTDQMRQFSTLYKLGLSSGYAYIHRPFFSPRTSRKIDRNIYPFSLNIFNPILKKTLEAIPGKKTYTPSVNAPNSNGDVYEFLGFNDYFQSRQKGRPAKSVREVRIQINNYTLKEFNITSLEDLRKWLDGELHKRLPGENAVLVELTSLSPRAEFFELVHVNVPDFPDGLDLRKIYFARRSEAPWDSVFPQGRLKTVVHMRQGDTAVLETPWNTVVSLWPKNFAFREYGRFGDIPDDRLMRPEDYYRFVTTLSSHFGEDAFSTLFFSDGFQRSWLKLKGNIRKFKSPIRKKLLMIDPDVYSDSKFKKFENLKNSRVFIGEEFDYLCHLIHSVLTADLLILSQQQRMILKLMANFFDEENTPTVIVLRRYNENNGFWDFYEGLGLGKRKEKFIHVDMDNVDYQMIIQKMKVFHKNLL